MILSPNFVKGPHPILDIIYQATSKTTFRHTPLDNNPHLIILIEMLSLNSHVRGLGVWDWRFGGV